MEKLQHRNTFYSMTGLSMLVFVCASLTDRPLATLPLRIGNFSLAIFLRAFDLIIIMTAILDAIGTRNVLKDAFDLSNRELMLHAFLPFAATMVIGFSLRNTTGGMGWWVILLLGVFLLLATFNCEYIDCDPVSGWRPVAQIILTGLCYAVHLMAMVALRINLNRLILVFPLIFLISLICSLRIYSFWLDNGQIHALVVSLITAMAASPLHYWPLNAVSYGILVFIWYYLFENVEILLGAGMTMERALKNQIPMLLILAGAFTLSLL